MMGVMIMNCSQEKPVIRDYEKQETIQTQIEKLAPVEIGFDRDLLTENEYQALIAIVKAAGYMDDIFLKQVYHKNEVIQQRLNQGSNPDYATLLQYFNICFGPFDRLENNKPFINLDETKPAGANYYPMDMTKQEFQDWIEQHPEHEATFTDNFTLIRRSNDGLKAIPYSQAYQEELTAAAKLLKEAAKLTGNPSLKTYLNSRAEAFLSNDYFQSDMDWMDLKDHTIEVVIGPYEVYEDELFGYKAAFEAFVTLVDPAESEKLRQVNKFLPEMENNLPIPPEYKNTRRGSASPIVVVQEVFTAGDTKAGIQTTAFNLPNDERVREAKGSKKVMLKNVAQAKYEKCWLPIVNEVIDERDIPYIKFDAYFNHVLMHEMSHGMGPGIMMKNGEETSVNKELKETYPTIEEAKADILGVYNTLYLIDRGFLPASMERETFATYLGGIFRSIRFGITGAHGGANSMSYNYIKEKGGFVYDASTGKFRVNMDKMEQAVRELAYDVLMIQAQLDYEGAVDFIEKYRYFPEEIRQALDRLSDVPIDIWPSYTIEKEL